MPALRSCCFLHPQSPPLASTNNCRKPVRCLLVSAAALGPGSWSLWVCSSRNRCWPGRTVQAQYLLAPQRSSCDTSESQLRLGWLASSAPRKACPSSCLHILGTCSATFATGQEGFFSILSCRPVSRGPCTVQPARDNRVAAPRRRSTSLMGLSQCNNQE